MRNQKARLPNNGTLNTMLGAIDEFNQYVPSVSHEDRKLHDRYAWEIIYRAKRHLNLASSLLKRVERLTSQRAMRRREYE